MTEDQAAMMLKVLENIDRKLELLLDGKAAIIVNVAGLVEVTNDHDSPLAVYKPRS